MTLGEAITLAVVEGVTEYLPVSSTGHMIVTSSVLGIGCDNFTKLFTIAVQLGAILAVVALYWRKFINLRDYRFYLKLGIAVIPALVFGKLLDDFIDSKLGNPVFIGCTLLGGGILLLFVDNWFRNPKIKSESEIGFLRAFFIGCWQVLAVLLPGLSRSASTIIGGMQQKLSRDVAAEFSFFLAVPTMLAATGYSLFLKDWVEGGVSQKGYEMVLASSDNTMAFAVGNLVAFIVAVIAVKLFIGMVKKFGFRIWGYYRIVVGAAVLVMYLTNAITLNVC